MSADATTSTPAARIPARPTTYNGVKMRSRLEAAYAQQFDAFGWAWEYEPECFGSGHGQYLPDFRLTLNPEAPTAHTYVEVKPYIDMPTFGREVDRMDHYWRTIKASEPDAAAMLLVFSSWLNAGIFWMGLIDDWERPHPVAPMLYDGGTYGICSEINARSFGARPLGVPAPVDALYAELFLGPALYPEDLFGLRTKGC